MLPGQVTCRTSDNRIGLAESCPALSEQSTEETAYSDPMAGESSEGYALWNAFVSGWPKKARDMLALLCDPYAA